MSERQKPKATPPPKLDGTWNTGAQGEQWRWNGKSVEYRRTEDFEKLCPFKGGRYAKQCVPSCKLNDQGVCLLKAGHLYCQDNQDESTKPFCPFMRRCTDRCALYENGCELASFLRFVRGKGAGKRKKEDIKQ